MKQTRAIVRLSCTCAFAAVAILVSCCHIASARDFGRGAMPLVFDPGAATAFADSDQLHIEGVVHEATPAAIAVRIDDATSSAYATRFNDERRLPPGPFRIAIGLKGLKTPSGRVLDPANIRRIIVFAWDGKPNVTITRFETARGAVLPAAATGYAFGARDAAVPPGFERVGPDDSRVEGRGPVQVVRRPAPDPLLANGFKNVQRIRLPSPGGRVRVTVWSEDPGEWETLPHPSVRRILVNGRVLIDEKRTAEQWISERYLRGVSVEHSSSDDAWSAYGAHRGIAAAIDVDTSAGGTIVIDFIGADPTALFINAVLIEPIADTVTASHVTAGQAFVVEQRAQWYRERFPVAAAPAADDGAITVGLRFGTDGHVPPIELRAAADSGSGVLLRVTADIAIAQPKITVTAPRRGSTVLAARLWVGQNKLERDDSVLRLRDNRLLADTSALGLGAGVTRGYELWIDVPKSAPPGVYAGALTFASATQARTVPIEVTVPNVTLPPVAKPAGAYLARAAHLNYFPGLTLEREQQVACDLDLLRGFGLTNTAPPIGGLDRTDLGLFATEMRRAHAAGIAPGWLIYNPLDELVAAQGAARAAATVGRLEALIRAQNLPQPLWSVADEPSNPDQHSGPIDEWVRLLRSHAPSARLAGHLNAPSDQAFVPLFDTVIVNSGFGIDAATLHRLKAAGKGVWLYNTGAPRQTAGLWLWHTAADRYVQWHARMPTADPFDPLDGREADYQMIYPSSEICPHRQDIHRDLLRLAEGVVDQRWLTWLDTQSGPAARRLAADLHVSLPGPFDDARVQTRAQLESLRNRIMDLVP